MKYRKNFYFFIIVLCLITGYWQSKNLQKVWREYNSFYKYLIDDDYSFKIAKLSLPPKAVAKDPEAAAVAKVKIFSFSNLEREEEIKAILEIQKEFPDNEYILFRLVRNLSLCDEVIDPLIALRYTEKLIELNPDNAIYHLMKCHLLLIDQTGDDINHILDELEYANKCTQYYLPYQQYEHRVFEIAKQAGFGQYILRILSNRFTTGYPYYYSINNTLLNHANKAFTDNQRAKGIRITNALNNMQKLLVYQNDRYYICSMNLGLLNGPLSFGHWRYPQSLELQRTNLTKERASLNRMQLCALMSRTTQSRPNQKKSKEKFYEKIWNVSLMMLQNIILTTYSY